MVYVVITFVALAFLNVYCSIACQRVFYQSKETSMSEKIQLTASELSKLEEFSPDSIASAVSRLSTLRVNQIIITNQSGLILYDSTGASSPETMATQPQILQSLTNGEVFTWNYRRGTIQVEAAAPILHGRSIIGCVYMLEIDSQQGMLLRALQSTIPSVTAILMVLIVTFSIIFPRIYSNRMEKIMNSVRIIQQGDYSHRMAMSGNDELTALGNEFNELTELLQISENKRRQFVSDASHELKTPLASIKLLADSILQNDMDMETIREFVGDIGEEAERLNSMSQKLLDLTRGEDADADVAEIIYMAPSVKRVVRMLSTLAKQSDVEIIMDLERDIPILIMEDDLYRIIYNLVENGIKYNVPGGKLTISLDRTEECGILKVSDTGTGIPGDAVPHLFERFYRVDKARSRASGGSGLGLAIVRNMVERNQGKIYVDSTFGQGTTFTVEFTAFDTEEEGDNL